MKKTIKRKVAGFTTIECCLLIPILLMLYSFIVYIGLFQYNRCVLQTNLYLLGLKGKEFSASSSDEYMKQLQDYEKSLYNEKYLLLNNLQIVYCTSKKEKSIKSNASMENPLYTLGVGDRDWVIEAECTVNNINPASVLFLCKHASNILEK